MARKTATKKASARSSASSDSNAGASSSKKSVYVWLKSTAYISDEKRVDAGLYLVGNVPERIAQLAKIAPSECEIFEASDIKDGNVLFKIARRAGINPDGQKTDVLLEKLTKFEFKPF